MSCLWWTMLSFSIFSFHFQFFNLRSSKKVFLKNTHSLLKINYWISLAAQVTTSLSSRCSIRDSSLTKAIPKLTALLKILTDLQFDWLIEPDPQFFLCQVLRALLFRCATCLFLYSVLISSAFTPTLRVRYCTENRRKVVILSCGSTFPPSLTSSLSSVYFPSPSCFTCSIILA